MARFRSRTALRDVGGRMVGDGDCGVWRPLGRFYGRASLGGFARPASEVLEDAPRYARIVD